MMKILILGSVNIVEKKYLMMLNTVLIVEKILINNNNIKFEQVGGFKMEYPEGEVFCPICHKKLIDENDKERGYHYHCEKSEVFCK